jgi:hypothetical protein
MTANRGVALRPWPMILIRMAQTKVIDRVVGKKGRLCGQDCTKTNSNALNDVDILITYCFY